MTGPATVVNGSGLHSANVTILAIFWGVFALVALLGFVAARWRRASLDSIEQWGIGGRTFGTILVWFLIGGDLYTAYTFIAVPALAFGKGGLFMFALAYTVIVYPLALLFMPRLWAVSKTHGYVTAGDFVRGRWRSPLLAALVAITGIVATMPYIALQIVGIRVVLTAMGIGGDLPVILAFVVLALYTYRSGLRAPTLVAVVKDILIYSTILVAVIYIPLQIGGYGHIFASAKHVLDAPGHKGSFIISGTSTFWLYATLAFGSAMALFMYPHAVTATLASRSSDTVRRNMSLLPAYTILLGLIGLLGFMALAVGIKPSTPNFALPNLFLTYFPHWFVAIAFAAIAIGALVPAAVMAIATANTFTRNIYREYVRPNASEQEQARVAKLVSLVVKGGALAYTLALPTKYSINLQLLGGVWMLQIFPAVVVGLYTRWFNKWALIIGWVVGMGLGTWMAASVGFTSGFGITIGGFPIKMYNGFWAVLANFALVVTLTPIFRAAGLEDRADETAPEAYDELRTEPVERPRSIQPAAT